MKRNQEQKRKSKQKKIEISENNQSLINIMMKLMDGDSKRIEQIYLMALNKVILSYYLMKVMWLKK